jgi:hypothetical protein
MLLFLCGFLISCEGSLEFKELTPQDKLETSLTWESVRTRIMVPYCVHCHRQMGNYSVLFKIQNEALQTVESNDMPLDTSLPPELKALLRDWIKAGAPE